MRRRWRSHSPNEISSGALSIDIKNSGFLYVDFETPFAT
jgi:hypothetical protein